MQTRHIVILVVAVAALVLLWPDDEPPPEEKKPRITSKAWKPRPPQHEPWQLRQPPQQAPRGPNYTAPYAGAPYASDGTGPYGSPGGQPGPYGGYGTQPQYPPAPQTGYATPQPQQPAPYGGYGYQQPQPQQGYGMALPPQQYPGSFAPGAPPYGYGVPPTYRFRPLEEEKREHRRPSNYPQYNPAYPGASDLNYGSQR